MNTISATIIVGFRPTQSESTPPDKDPTAAPIIVKATINSFYVLVILGKSISMYKLAPAITDVSYPKRNPPIAEIKEIEIKNPIFTFGGVLETVFVSKVW